MVAEITLLPGKHLYSQSMEQLLGDSTLCNSSQLKTALDWRLWNKDFAEAEEVNSIAKLQNVEADSMHFNCNVWNTRSKGRGRINICLRNCKIPTAEQIAHNAYSSILSSSSQLPTTGKFCKYSGKGRGRGRLMQGFQPSIGQKSQYGGSGPLRTELGCKDSHYQSNTERSQECTVKLTPQKGCLEDILQSLEEPEKWILVDGIPETPEGKKELVSIIEDFGKIQSFSFHDPDRALIRMSKELQCEWVISCLHGTQLSVSSHTVSILRIKDIISDNVSVEIPLL